MEYRLDTFVEQEYKLSENICLVIEEQEIYVEVDSIHFPLSKEILENKLNCLWVDIFLTLNINDVKHGKFNIIVNEVI